MHFSALVLVPPDADDVWAAVSTLLEPHQMDFEVAPYEEACSCVGKRARSAAYQAAQEETGTDIARITAALNNENTPDQQRLRHLINARLDRGLSEAEELEYDGLEASDVRRRRERSRPFWAARTAALDAHPLKEVPDPDCAECHGTGWVLSTDNRNWTWDYRVGRSKRTFDELGPLADFPAMPSHWKAFEGDAAPARLIAETCPVFYALVTPDGIWHQEAESFRLPYARRKAAAEHWAIQFRVLLRQHLDCLAVACGLHS